MILFFIFDFFSFLWFKELIFFRNFICCLRLFQWFLISRFRNNMYFTILWKIKTFWNICFSLFFYDSFKFNNLIIFSKKNKLLLFVKDLHLIQKVFFNEFTILLYNLKIKSSFWLQFNRFKLRVAIFNLDWDKHIIKVTTR